MRTRSIARSVLFGLATILSLTIAGSRATRGDLITPNPDLPPFGGYYETAFTLHADYPGAVIVSISNVQHIPESLISRTSSGGNDFETMSSQLTGLASINGGSAVPFTLTGPVEIEVFSYAPGNTGTFSTQMLSMDMTGTVGGHSVAITLDNNLGNSTGQTTITPIGGGLYDINSFFDVFTELSLDGGTAQPQSGGPSVVILTSPEPSTWAMLIAAGLIVPAYARWGRRRA